MVRISLNALRCCVMFVLLAAFAVLLSAQRQSVSPSSGFVYDNYIYHLRNDIAPDFHFTYDNYIQYTPAVILYITKACGVESRSSWPKMLASDAFAMAFCAAAVQGMKYTTCRPRPDSGKRNSFPSGHTATTFMTATMLHYEYSKYSPWFGFAGYAFGVTTALSRVLNNQHWLSDTYVGAAVGVMSVALSYIITDVIFKDKHFTERYKLLLSNKFDWYNMYTLEVLYGYRFGFGAAATNSAYLALQSEVPLCDSRFGLSFRAGINEFCWNDSTTLPTYNTLVGGFYRKDFERWLELETKALIGTNFRYDHVGFDVAADISLGFSISENYKLKLFTGMEYLTFPKSYNIYVGTTAAYCW